MSLKRRLELELEYNIMVQQDEYDATILCKLIRKVCYESTPVVVDDIVSTVLEALCNY